MKILMMLFLMFACFINCNNYSEAELWPNGVVSYTFASNMTDENKISIREVMNIWEISGIKFVETNNGPYIIRMEKNVSCYRSSVGYNRDDANYLIIPVWANKKVDKRTISHELGHCLGLRHEHQRIDRDKYINVLWNNIQEIYKKEFNITDNNLLPDWLEYSYDYDSIMHYFAYMQGSVDDNLPVIDFKEHNVNIHITELDVLKIRNMYNTN